MCDKAKFKASTSKRAGTADLDTAQIISYAMYAAELRHVAQLSSATDEDDELPAQQLQIILVDCCSICAQINSAISDKDIVQLLGYAANTACATFRSFSIATLDEVPSTVSTLKIERTSISIVRR